jgi:dihydroneopterin aldolase
MSHFSTRVFVRALRVEAEIGMNAHEQGRRQTLIVDVELALALDPSDRELRKGGRARPGLGR